VNTSRSLPHSWLITGFVTRLTRRVPLVEQVLPTLPEHLSSLPVFSWVCVTRSLVLCVCFVDRCLYFCHFIFGHCAVCPSLIYGSWLLLWYLQTLLEWIPLSSSIYLCCYNVGHFIKTPRILQNVSKKYRSGDHSKDEDYDISLKISGSSHKKVWCVP
jgi:hypothetical protein